MGTGDDSHAWQGQDAAAITKKAQAEAVKTTTSDEKAAALGGEGVGAPPATGARATPAIATAGATVQCVDPAAVKAYQLRCTQLPKAIRELLEDLMGADDLIITYNTQLEPKRCHDCTPFARRDVLDMTFGRVRAELLEGNVAESFKLRAWRYFEAGDDSGRIKFGTVNPMLNLKDLPREYGVSGVLEEESVRFPRYPLAVGEQELAKNDALDRLTAITALPAFVDIFAHLAQANPRLREQMKGQLQALMDRVSAWRCGVDDRGTDGGWRHFFPIVECAQLPASPPARPGEKLEKIDLEKAASEYLENVTSGRVSEGPPSRKLPEEFLSFALNIDAASHRALQRQKKAASCDLPPLRVEFKHAQPTQVSQPVAQVVEDQLQLQDAIASVRAAAVVFLQMKLPLKIVIRGYTDLSGTPKFDNVMLSRFRVQWIEAQIRTALAEAISQVQIQTIGCGDRFADRSQPKHRPSRVGIISYAQGADSAMNLK